MKLEDKSLSPFLIKGRYRNHKNEKPRGFLPQIAHLLSDSWKHRFFTPEVPKQKWHKYCKPNKSTIEPVITWIGHATFLIQIGGLNIVTDPIFGDITFLFPRIFPPGIRLNDLPPLDAILISHNHRDHMDARTLYALRRKLKSDGVSLVPKGNKKWFDQHRFSNTHEHTWWEYRRHKECRFTFLPSYHWSQRGLLDYNKALWGSWMIEYNGFCLYFGGDSAYANHFSAISKKFPNIDTALIPVAPCEPKEFMQGTHLNAEEAGQAFLDLKARSMIPMHWGTFYFGSDSLTSPIQRLLAWWKHNEKVLGSSQLHFLKVGEHRLFKPDWLDPSRIEALRQVSAP